MTMGASSLGSAAFRRDHGVRLAYAAGAMAKGIASPELVIRMARAGLLSWYGAGGQRHEVIRAAIRRIAEAAGPQAPWGVNVLQPIGMHQLEDTMVDLLLAEGVRSVEAAAYTEMTPALIRYRAAGLSRAPDGSVRIGNRIVAKVSRLEVAEAFMRPPTVDILRALVEAGRINSEAAAIASRLPVADDICAEADSGGHTDRRVALVLLPSIKLLAKKIASEEGWATPSRVGLAGGLGTPSAIAAAFAMGADFVVTGSINQCTPEAGTSDGVKDLLSKVGPQDTDFAPAGDMFEIGARVQCVRRGQLFTGRANRLYDIWRTYDSLDALPSDIVSQIEKQYFRKTIPEVWAETEAHYRKAAPEILASAERVPKQKLAMVLRWYWINANRMAIVGDESRKADWQVHSGPAMGAFNEWARGGCLEDWRSRHVDIIALALMEESAALLSALPQQGNEP